MNIAIVNSEIPSSDLTPAHGGIATFSYTLSNALALEGHAVHLFVIQGTRISESLHPNIHCHAFGWKPRRWPMKHFTHGSVEYQKGLSRSLHAALMTIHRTTPLHAVDIPEYNGLACQFPRRTPFATVITFHTPTWLVDELNNVVPDRGASQLYRAEKQALKKARGFKSPSHALKKKVGQRYGIASDAIEVIKNPFDISLFNAISVKRTNDPFYHILFSGRLEPRKGAGILCARIRDILSISDDIHLTIAGDVQLNGLINYRNTIEKMLTPAQRSRLWIPGPQQRSMLPAIYRNSDCFLMPSLFDNAPYALLEAMAACLPVVANDTGGINEIVRHGKNGLLFNVSDTSRMVTHIRTLYNDPAYAATLGNEAAATVQREHDIDAIARASVAFYQRMQHS